MKKSLPLVYTTSERIRVEFWTSVGGTEFMAALVAELEAIGYEAVEVSAVTETDYRKPRGRIGGIKVRWKLYTGLLWRGWNLRKMHSSCTTVRVATTNPFFLSSWLRAVDGDKRAKHIFLLWDLYPDVLEVSGRIRAGGWISKRLGGMTQRSLLSCSATVFLGWQQQKHVEARYGSARASSIIPVGANGTPFRSEPPALAKAGTPVVCLYAGHMGHIHETETLCLAIKSGVPPGLILKFHASGAGYSDLRRQVPAVAFQAERVEFAHPLPQGEWFVAMRDASVALITLQRKASHLAMPSKTFAALVAGQAILAVCALDSDLGQLVLKHRCGWVVEPGDVTGLERALNEISGDAMGLLDKRRRAYEAGHRYYDCQVVARHWDSLLRKVTEREEDDCRDGQTDNGD